MPPTVEDALRQSSMFRRLKPEDRQKVAESARVRTYAKGEPIFTEGDPSEVFYLIISGRVKIVKTTPGGRDMILEVFGAGDPFGALAVYEGRPFPASAIALEDTASLLIGRTAFFALLEERPSIVRGLLVGLTQRLVELTNRLTEVTGGRIETRFARLFLKLAEGIGRPAAGGIFVPMALSRQELADMTGTTIETCIRIMSRWNKQDVIRTEKDGFTVLDKATLEESANS